MNKMVASYFTIGSIGRRVVPFGLACYIHVPIAIDFHEITLIIDRRPKNVVFPCAPSPASNNPKNPSVIPAKLGWIVVAVAGKSALFVPPVT